MEGRRPTELAQAEGKGNAANFHGERAEGPHHIRLMFVRQEEM
jgi:hypothetical protein